MYNGIQKINTVIDYIEANINDTLDYTAMAAEMNLSVYEFRRIFSFVVGCPISEYVRKRKLSRAALEIMESEKVDILAISEKYGYSNQSAFTRAFCEQHGISPTACLYDECEINLFTRPKFELSISGREDIPLKVIKAEDYFINGFCGVSNITDSCCCENVWNDFYESGIDKAIKADRIYVSYQNQGENVMCCIGEKGNEGQRIVASRWACFKLNTVDDDIVNEKYSKILYEWLPSVNLKRREGVPIVEVFPIDMSQDGFEWEIRIPIETGIML